jgi:hypothetical protein
VGVFVTKTKLPLKPGLLPRKMFSERKSLWRKLIGATGT